MGQAFRWSVRADTYAIRDPSGPDCCNEGLDAHELDHPLHVVGEHAKAHLGSDVPDMMLEAIENRFGACRTPTPIEMLTDNGSAYTARETRIFARQIGLKSCFTPVKSPQSNGISEAFVHTLKRDYVHVSPLPNARHALALLASWIEDYNENHPHSGLKMRSPREFRAAQFATP